MNNSYATWVPSFTGRYLVTFETYELAVLFNIKFGGGLEIIENKYEKY